jgi:hypothetical protein
MSLDMLAFSFSPTGSLDSCGFDVGGLSDHDLVEAMVAARRLASRVQAVELAAVAELARRRFAEAEATNAGQVVEVLSPADYVYDEVAEALTLTSASADGLIRFATDVTGRLPGTFAALAAGDIDSLKARTIWQGTGQIDEDAIHAIEAEVLPKAPRQTSGQIRAKIRRLIRRLDPEAADRRRAAAEKRRRVELIETEDDTAQLSGMDLPADAASAAYGRLNAIAAGLKRDGEDRSIDQLRADVFLGLLRGTLTTTEPPADTTTRPAQATTAAADPGWTSVDDAIAGAIAEAARAELAALTGALVAEAHAHDGEFPTAAAEGHLPERHRDPGPLIIQAGERIHRSLAELRQPWCVPAPPPAPPTVLPTGHGIPRYRPSAAMRRLIQHRDRRCAHPGCRRPVHHCDTDHTLAYHRGGATCPCNLAMLCRRHHRLKATKNWHIEQLWPGVILWIAPTGHWKITAPADRE